MFCAHTRTRYQVSVYRTIGPLVLLLTGRGMRIKGLNARPSFMLIASRPSFLNITILIVITFKYPALFVSQPQRLPSK